jgi:hypothetical protein
MAASDSLHSSLDECLLFCVTHLVLIYESVTSSASVFRWLTLHSWTVNSLTTDSLNSLTNDECLMNESESESELLYDWRSTANHFVLATSPLRPTTRIFIFQLNTCGFSPYVTSSLMRGWVCHLQLLLVLASAVILGSDSRGAHDHILLLTEWINLLCTPTFIVQRVSIENVCCLCVSMEIACWFRWHGKRVPYKVGLHESASPQKRVLASRCLAMDYSGFQMSGHNIM